MLNPDQFIPAFDNLGAVSIIQPTDLMSGQTVPFTIGKKNTMFEKNIHYLFIMQFFICRLFILKSLLIYHYSIFYFL
jgi:hypothetical protein